MFRYLEKLAGLIKKRKSLLAAYSASCMRKGNFGMPAFLEVAPIIGIAAIYAFKELKIDHSKVPAWITALSVLVFVLIIPVFVTLWLASYNLLKSRMERVRAKYKKP